jgi:thioredoxin-dependent peroxiredoxin
MLSEKQPAPEFELATDEGKKVKLSDYRGQKVILYFYPKDDTPGCTTQACDLRDHIKEIDSKGAVVLGVSPDDVASHQSFKKKFNLNFPLLADVDHKVAEAYGVWKEKNLYGKKTMGVERTSFIIDEQGKIAKILPRVKPAEHVGQIFESL